MTEQLAITLGQYSDKGRKDINQDFYGARIPDEPELELKGIAIALADGISSSNVSEVASEAAVTGFLEDYYCTSDAWSVKSSAQRVLSSINSWLYSQTHQSQYRYERDKGYVCTFSALVIKSTTAHIFHVGDSRVYRVYDNALEQLTVDHRVWVAQEQSYLAKALGMSSMLELDYQAQSIEEGDIFLLATDGVHEHISHELINKAIAACGENLNLAAKEIALKALHSGSGDNLTIQLVRVDTLPDQQGSELYQQVSGLPFPPVFEPRESFDGYKIERQLYASSRSHVYLGVDESTQERVIIKAPSTEFKDDAAYLERFLLEEWIARRINNAHVLKPCSRNRKKNFIYVATEYIEGQTLTQWMIDNPKPSVAMVRDIIEQIARGLLAFHRLEMLHQDLRPENVMVEFSGTVKIIDFGSTRVAGLSEISGAVAQPHLLGTAQFTAPEYFVGEMGSTQSDLFSLGVIAYQMLSGDLPYGVHVAKARSKAAQRRLVYRSVLREDRETPAWLDETLKRAVHPDRAKRYQELSEFIYDLSHPSDAYLNKVRPPIIERYPVVFWQIISLFLSLIILYLLSR